MEQDRSPERKKRIQDVLSKKQPSLTVVLENVHDPHNIMAAIRSCDAVGVLEIHIVESIKATWDQSIGKRSSAGSKKWIKVNQYSTIDQCYQQLREEGKSIFTTHLSKESKDLYDLDLVQPVAMVFGNEHRGLTEEAMEGADGNFIIPQMGMIQSLNISVACAVSLFEALRQRKAAGLYAKPQLDESSLENLRLDWLRR